MSEANTESSQLIDRFCDRLWLEDGLSQNTLSAYRRDLAGFAAWLKEARGRDLAQAVAADIDGYLATTGRECDSSQVSAGASTRRQAAHVGRVEGTGLCP